MAVQSASLASLRVDRLESTRLAWAFALSVALHLLIWGGYAGGKRLGVWELAHWPTWARTLVQVLVPPAPKPLMKPVDRDPPLMFVDVGAAQATTEPPKNPLFYSDKNSQAANPDADKNTGIPKVDGNQTDMVKAEDVPRSRYDRLQPAPPAPPAPREQPAEQPRPKPAVEPGDLTLGRPEPNPRVGEGTAEQPRPRTIREAMLQKSRDQLAGQKMKQDGGVSRRFPVSFDVKATGIGIYDRVFVEAVEQRWFDLLDNLSYDGYRRGKVVLQFRLNYDGRITEMQFKDNTVGEMLGVMCRKAVEDPAPYDRWPTEMRKEIEGDFRTITFTFYYN